VNACFKEMLQHRRSLLDGALRAMTARNCTKRTILAHGGWFVVCWFPTSTIRFSAETSTAINLPPQSPRTPLPTLAPSKVSVTVTTRGRTMGFSCRTFLIARDDTLWRLSSTRFDRMLRDPASHCLPVFAGQRARMASVVVELVARNPVRVVRNTFSILTFDVEGRIDPSRFEKQQFALAESVVAPAFAGFDDDSNQTVVDATSRFIAQGGQWVPSRALARAIDQTALGQRQCRHL